jgi:D-sedoheptulose 7-phosphate isomerase
MCRSAKEYFALEGQLSQALDYQKIDELADMLLEAHRRGQQVFIFGNGGSACTSSHWVIELAMNAATPGHKGLRAYALPDNVGWLTALANDNAYEDVFYYPLSTYARDGDIAVAISGSGNSPNVIKACQWAKENGVKIVGLTGFSGGKLKEMADFNIHIPNDNYGIIEDLHMSIGHLVGQRLSHTLAGETL